MWGADTMIITVSTPPTPLSSEGGQPSVLNFEKVGLEKVGLNELCRSKAD